MAITLYGDIQPRTAAYVAVDLLKRAMPYMVLEKFGQAKTLPANKTQSIKWRRYNALGLRTTALTEGVTPTADKMTATDVPITLYQYGGLIEITDIIQDTHEDPVLQEAISVAGEQAAKTVETLRWNALIAGTNVFYANSVAGLSSVAAVINRVDQRRVVRALERQEAQKLTSIVSSTPQFNKESILPAYVAVTHVDMTTDIRSMTGFTSCADYGQVSPWPTEIGACEDMRYIKSTIYMPAADAGSGTTTGMLTTSGVGCDAYYTLYIGRDAYGIVALKGKFAITPMVINPVPSKSDPLGQRGSVSWKTMQATVILNNAWMAEYISTCSS